MTAIPGKKSAYGAILKADALAGDSPGTYRNVAYIKSIDGPGLSVDMADVTTHDSSSAYEEVIPTVIRSEEITLELVYDPGDVTIKYSNGLLGKMAAKTLEPFKLVFYDDTVESSRTTWLFSAYITGFKPILDFAKPIGATMKLKISGAPTLV